MEAYVTGMIMFVIGIIIGRYTKPENVCDCRKCKKTNLPKDMVTGVTKNKRRSK